MNLIVCCAIYKGDSVTERGLRTMSFEIPGTGKKPLAIPVKLLPSYAAGETTAPSASRPRPAPARVSSNPKAHDHRAPGQAATARPARSLDSARSPRGCV